MKRFVHLWIVVTLLAPSPAFALKQAELAESRTGLEELKKSLEPFIQLARAAVPAIPSLHPPIAAPMPASGLEEARSSDDLIRQLKKALRSRAETQRELAERLHTPQEFFLTNHLENIELEISGLRGQLTERLTYLREEPNRLTGQPFGDPSGDADPVGEEARVGEEKRSYQEEIIKIQEALAAASGLEEPEKVPATGKEVPGEKGLLEWFRHQWDFEKYRDLVDPPRQPSATPVPGTAGTGAATGETVGLEERTPQAGYVSAAWPVLQAEISRVEEFLKNLVAEYPTLEITFDDPPQSDPRVSESPNKPVLLRARIARKDAAEEKWRYITRYNVEIIWYSEYSGYLFNVVPSGVFVTAELRLRNMFVEAGRNPVTVRPFSLPGRPQEENQLLADAFKKWANTGGEHWKRPIHTTLDELAAGIFLPGEPLDGPPSALDWASGKEVTGDVQLEQGFHVASPEGMVYRITHIYTPQSDDTPQPDASAIISLSPRYRRPGSKQSAKLGSSYASYLPQNELAEQGWRYWDVEVAENPAPQAGMEEGEGQDPDLSGIHFIAVDPAAGAVLARLKAPWFDVIVFDPQEARLQARADVPVARLVGVTRPGVGKDSYQIIVPEMSRFVDGGTRSVNEITSDAVNAARRLLGVERIEREVIPILPGDLRTELEALGFSSGRIDQLFAASAGAEETLGGML
ncbi:MAG: hypothetical protein HY594_04160 [Candidatus Omnitrophica bacterium]|nr:hypothetical protein [Candidatus Omnitrophota bacterium]